MTKSNFTRRGMLKTGAIAGAGVALPTIFTASSARAYTNEPTGGTVTLGFNVPQTGLMPKKVLTSCAHKNSRSSTSTVRATAE